MIFEYVLWGGSKASWIFVSALICSFIVEIKYIIVVISCSPLQWVVMLLLTKGHLWEFRAWSLIPWPGHRCLPPSKRPLLHFLLSLVPVQTLLSCLSQLLQIVLLPPFDYPCLRLAVLPAHGTMPMLAIGWCPFLAPLRRIHPVKEGGIILSFIVGIGIRGGRGGRGTFTLNNGRFLQLRDAALSRLWGARWRVVTRVAILEQRLLIWSLFTWMIIL